MIDHVAPDNPFVTYLSISRLVSSAAANKIEIAAADSYLILQCIWKES